MFMRHQDFGQTNNYWIFGGVDMNTRGPAGQISEGESKIPAVRICG
jgi:hypothetical protein